MADGFASGSLSVALSALVAAVLFLSLPTKNVRDPVAQPADDAAPLDPRAEPLGDQQAASSAAGAESVVLPPPPAPRQSTPVKAPVTAAKNMVPELAPELVPELVVVPLQPAAPQAQPSPPEIVEPLRPSPRLDPAPEEAVAEPPRRAPIQAVEAPAEAVPDAEQPPEPEPTRDAVPEPAPTSTPTPALHAAVVAEGRVQLRILEHGSGPVIEIAWPADRGKRRQLFQLFQSCFGMQLALMDEHGGLFIADGVPGQKWNLSLDRYSGFVRQTSGRLSTNEDRQVQSIRAFHGGLGRTASVRIFPRKVDAILLGGLHQLIGGRYEAVGSIHASYRMDGGRVVVEAIEADGVPVPGRVALSGAARSSCRHGGVT